MAGVINNPNDPNNPFFGTDADPRSPFVFPRQPNFGQNLTPRQGNMYSQQASPYYNPPGSVISAPQPVKPMPMPNQPIIDRPAPGYGQQPTRGPAPRDMTPMTLQQGLGGLKR